MNRCPPVVALLVCLLAGTGSAECLANMISGASYSVSPQPNYRGTARADVRTALTDGRHALGLFWLSTATLGWQRQSVIRIEVDLTHAAMLDQICIRTARGEHAGVRLPRRVDVFASEGQNAYSYAASIAPARDTRHGRYEVVRLCAQMDAVVARALVLFIEPDGGFFFIDELEATGRSVAAVAQRRSHTSTVQAAQLDSTREQVIQRSFDCLRQQRNESALRDSVPIAARDAFDARWSPLVCAASSLRGTALTEELQIRAEQQAAWRRELIARQWGESLLVSLADPWSDAPATRLPSLPVVPPVIDAPGNAHSIVSLMVTNAARRPASVSVEIASGSIRVRPFRVMAVQTDDGQFVNDALIPLRETLGEMSPGESMQLWFDLETPGKSAGEHLVQIGFLGADARATLPVKVRVSKVDVDSALLPAADVWAYRTDRLIRDAWPRARDDLREHNVNVAVLHPADLPWPLSEEAPEREQFRQRLAQVADARYVLLYLGLNVRYWRQQSAEKADFVSDAWLAGYSRWLQQRNEDLAAAGVDRSKVLIYPIDEPRDDTERVALERIARKTRENGLRVFTTLDRPGIDKLSGAAPWLDVVQLRIDRTTQQDVKAWRGLQKEVWLYQPEGGGKAADASGFYRAAAWRAYERRADGIGFWAYADIGQHGSEWNDRDGERPDFAVVYRHGADIVSSRRWEAWRLGLEEFALLRMAAEAPGNEERVRRLVEEVLDRKGTAAALDSARGRLLNVLAQVRADATGTSEE